MSFYLAKAWSLSSMFGLGGQTESLKFEMFRFDFNSILRGTIHPPSEPFGHVGSFFVANNWCFFSFILSKLGVAGRGSDKFHPNMLWIDHTLKNNLKFIPNHRVVLQEGVCTLEMPRSKQNINQFQIDH